MNRLTAYLVRIFANDAIALLAIVTTLLWLVQCLRIFDVVSVRGQGMLTLAGQALLSMPALIVAFLYVSMGIGLSRALGALQNNNELHIIHSSLQVPALLKATAIYSTLGALFVLTFSNIVEPVANQRLSSWSASIAADLVGRTLTPHRFTQMVPGVVVMIGGREGGGVITEFFADDRRDPNLRRTYIAKSATIAQDETGHVLQLRDGSLQYTPDGLRFSEVSFARYDIGIERLTTPIDSDEKLSEQNSVSLIAEAISTGVWRTDVVNKIVERMGEGLRVFGICICVLAVAGFPNARRSRRKMPLELGVLVLAFIERGISAYAPLPAVIAPLTGAALMLIGGAAVLLWRLREPRAPVAQAVPA